MKIEFKDLIKNSSILSIPGFISIFISLLSIPIHLNYAGSENYGNYIIFHFILLISINFNFGIGKSTVISINNFPEKKKEIAFKAIGYTKNISIVILFTFLLIYFANFTIVNNFFDIKKSLPYFLLGSIITIFFVTFEGILQGNRKFKSISILNLLFYSFSISIPSLLLVINDNLDVESLISISIVIKLISVLIMFLIIHNNNLIKFSKTKILMNNLKKNSRWITLNSILVQFYDLFDKYLIKIFLGPIAVATYSIPQQLTGKLSIISKSFSAFLLPNLSKKKINNRSLNFSLYIFVKIIPIIILILMPLYPFILGFWLGSSFNETIHNLTKIFSISVIFSCASHLLVTKFEASKTLYKNLKVELILMPFFIFSLYLLTSGSYTLFAISILILFKELVLFFLRLNYLKSEIIRVASYYYYSIYILLMLFSSFYNNKLYYFLLIVLILNFIKRK